MNERLAAACMAASLLAGCASVSPPSPAAARPMQPAHSATAAAIVNGWEHLTFPGKSPTRFSHDRKDGREAVRVVASSSASMLRQRVNVAPGELGHVRFSWLVPQLIAGADLRARDADDSPVRIVLAFEGDRSRFSQRDSLLSELSQTLTGEQMPYATLMYVWCNQRAPGTVIASPRTDRIRKMVVESGAARLGRWLEYERDIAADFRRAFGEDPGALVGIGIMTDTDNTRSTTLAWYGPLQFVPARAR